MKILYICTHNRCRSILSEAITNHHAAGHIVARSAGSAPSGEVHPLTLRFLQQAGYSTNQLKSQSWNDFQDFQPDLVVTVCDTAARETCPVYLHDCASFHWGLSDPSKVEGSDDVKEKAFLHCMREIEQRVEKLQAIVSQQPTAKDRALKLAQLEFKSSQAH